MRKNETIPPEYFEKKYKADIDPWHFRTSEYERDKYQATLGSLTKDKYASALEVGCSIGVLTRLLSPRCVRLLAVDASSTAIEAARSINDPNVTFRVANLPAEFPKGTFDLIVLSEVLIISANPIWSVSPGRASIRYRKMARSFYATGSAKPTIH